MPLAQALPELFNCAFGQPAQPLWKIVFALIQLEFSCPQNSGYHLHQSPRAQECDVSQVFPSAEFFLFEPLFDFKQGYQERYAKAINRRRNFHLFKIALGEHDGETKIFSDPAGYSASILPTQPSEHLHEEIMVTLNRLDTIVAKNGLAAPEVLKLDVSRRCVMSPNHAPAQCEA
jgi:FkbM family methyltransferase